MGNMTRLPVCILQFPQSLCHCYPMLLVKIGWDPIHWEHNNVNDIEFNSLSEPVMNSEFSK